ncbi:MAG: tetratricopeptide repeat protein [Leptolyngbyaceae cyanobacterium SM1_4_3]|nr:tetratricopeptide repeat protein [Leptolyngbyaceae cyanobacterium SM1_4_3]
MVSTVDSATTAAYFTEKAEAHLSAGRLTEAIATCERALSVQADFAPACKLLGNALQRAGKNEAARDWYQKALTIQPDWAEAHANLGSLHAQQQQWQQAIARFQKAIALKPNFAGAYRNLARVLTHTGNAKTAAECWYQL